MCSFRLVLRILLRTFPRHHVGSFLQGLVCLLALFFMLVSAATIGQTLPSNKYPGSNETASLIGRSLREDINSKYNELKIDHALKTEGHGRNKLDLLDKYFTAGMPLDRATAILSAAGFTLRGKGAIPGDGQQASHIYVIDPFQAESTISNAIVLVVLYPIEASNKTELARFEAEIVLMTL